MPVKGTEIEGMLKYDKLAHVLMYAGMSATMLFFYWKKVFDRKSITYTFLFSISYGFLLEILQNSTLSQREFDIFDIAANIIGAALGIILFKVFKNYFL